MQPAHADGGERLAIDSAASRIEFAVRLMLVKRLDGRFPRVEGEVRLDPAQGRAGIDVRIDAREVEMARASWADWARSAEFFDAAHHPWIRFQAADVPLVLFRDGGALQGMLTLRGTTRPVTLEVLPSICEHPGTDCPVRAEGALERNDFGMTARRFVLGNRVRLQFEIHVRPAQAEPAA